jgi:signal transduction histidine kinase
MMTRMGERLDDLAVVVAELARAAGTALDPSSILARTMAVLDPVLELPRVSLWLIDQRDHVELVATHPATRGPLHLDAEAALADAVTLPLVGRNQALGRLVAHPPADGWSPAERALLDIAAVQIAGALERAQLFAEVMELERLKTDFIARVSHELRTPITIINGFLETLIAHDERLDGEQRVQMLERSRAAAARLGVLIEELLIISRLEGGVLTPQPERIVLADLVDDVRAAVADPDHVMVVGDLTEPVVTDAPLLVHALGLLVDNAVKYGGAAELSSRLDGDGWVVEVRDRGPGFSPDVRPIAFEMFTRAQSSSTVPGLGAGLAIARTLVEVLDGSIAIVDPDAGPGTILRVRLPA